MAKQSSSSPKWLDEQDISDIFRSCFWDVDKDAISDGPIRGLADRFKLTVLSAKANSTSLLDHCAYRKWKEFTISTFDGNAFPFPPIPFAVPCICSALLRNPILLVLWDSTFYGIRWAYSLTGVAFPKRDWGKADSVPGTGNDQHSQLQWRLQKCWFPEHRR